MNDRRETRWMSHLQPLVSFDAEYTLAGTAHNKIFPEESDSSKDADDQNHSHPISLALMLVEVDTDESKRRFRTVEPLAK
jgi:hypothetical protein